MCTDHHRKKFPEQLPEDLPECDNRFGEIEEEMSFALILDSFPHEQREIVLLRFVHELKIREIAEVVGVPMRTVQSRLRRALKRLEKDLEEGS